MYNFCTKKGKITYKKYTISVQWTHKQCTTTVKYVQLLYKQCTISVQMMYVQLLYKYVILLYKQCKISVQMVYVQLL